MPEHEYSFLGIGRFYQLGVDVMVTAEKRFGAGKAESVIGRVQWETDHSNSFEELVEETAYETGYTLNQKDIEFVEKITRLEQMIKQVQEFMEEIVKSRKEGNDGSK